MFENYSQTYASQILAVAGMITAATAAFGHSFATPEVQFVLGSAVNIAGIVWALLHRHAQGDVSVAGVRK